MQQPTRIATLRRLHKLRRNEVVARRHDVVQDVLNAVAARTLVLYVGDQLVDARVLGDQIMLKRYACID